MADDSFSIIVFPFLKTSSPVQIGGSIFRSTDDTSGLPAAQAGAVAEIAQMLFVQDDLRVRSASYAVVPFLDLNFPSTDLDRLVLLRAVICYLYSEPHEVIESVFLAPEDVSLAVFSPGPVSASLVRPGFHTESVATTPGPTPDERRRLPGYHGLYNFRHHFWVSAGSRLYGPKPHIGLNISQNLFADLDRYSGRHPERQLLLELLDKPVTATTNRVFYALHWFNAANEDAADPDRALLSLAIAFEALLRLPASEKTERLVDAISLLVGRTERLDDWAKQFYDARSRVAHEGFAGDRLYYIPGKSNQKGPSAIYGSLMLYGRQIFQLCLGTLLVGVDLAERANLREKFVSNYERYEKICQALKSESGLPRERISAIAPIVEALRRYRFVSSGGTSREVLAGAVRRATSTLLECGMALAEELRDVLNKVATMRSTQDGTAELDSIAELLSAFETAGQTGQTPEECIVRDLVKIVWESFDVWDWG